jgi:hypothetical protein
MVAVPFVVPFVLLIWLSLSHLLSTAASWFGLVWYACPCIVSGAMQPHPASHLQIFPNV